MNMRRSLGGPWLLLALLPLLASCSPFEHPPGLLELGVTNFTETLADITENYDWVLMEFYAHWCPACRAFQPAYEEVAKTLALREQASPRIAVARVDCPDNQKLCESFQITGYPTMWLGTPEQMTTWSTQGLIKINPSQRSKDAVIKLLAEALHTNLDGLDAAVADDVGNGGNGADAVSTGGGKDFTQKQHLQIIKPLEESASLNDIEGATIKAYQFMTSKAMLRGLQAKQALFSWLQVLAIAHPIERCRIGAAQALGSVAIAWPTGENASKPSALSAIAPCGKSEFKDWTDCKGSTSAQRGYTCGLWQLFHSLAARMPDEDLTSGARWMDGVRGYIKYFFQCSDCASHFMGYATTPEADAITSNRDAVLWIWKTHNVVNERLAKEDAEDGTGDPASPHVQFPPQSMCPSCRMGGGDTWNEDAVYPFLLMHYGGKGTGKGAAVNGGTIGAAVNGGAVAAVGMRSVTTNGKGKGSSWSSAFLLMFGVSGVVYVSLRANGQYAIRRSMSRLL